MAFTMITEQAIRRRQYWIGEIGKISGNFGQDFTRLEAELSAEVQEGGATVVLDHVRLAGVIPEAYGHDTSEEKLYSKYTDALLAITFRALGLRSLVLTERADAADVEVFADGYAFVADAKAFRLTRTAKNQKDFKIQAMDGWRRDKKYALVVAPLYQLPTASSQIYQQAITRDVCILSYSHLAVLVRVAVELGEDSAQRLLTQVLAAVAAMQPGKEAMPYWSAINRVFVLFDTEVARLWQDELVANNESIIVSKEEGLKFIALNREAIMSLSHEEALRQLVLKNKLDSKIAVLDRTRDTGLFSIGIE